MKITVLQSCDGFTILIKDDKGRNLKRVWFSQEDGVESLIEVFDFLGFESSFGEDY